METLLAADLAPATLSSQGGTQGLPLGSQRNVQRKDSTLELVSDINPLEGEDLSGDWWKVQGPPEELYISGDNPSSEKLKNEVKKWVQEVRNTCPLIMDGCDAPEVVVVDPPAYEQTGPSSPCLPTMYEENPAELHNIFPTTVIFGDEKYPVPPSGPISVNRTSTTQSHTHARRISTSSSVARSSTFSGSHVAGMDNRTIGSLEAISVNSRGSVKKKPKPPPPKQEFTSDGSLAYNAYFSPLPANNKVVTSQAPQVSARAEALKKFFGKKKAPGSECASCKEDQKKGKMIQLDCLHQFCTRCMEESIKNSMRDETLFPPSCCQAEIPQKVIKSTLTKQDQELYMSKTQEFRIPRSERFYCPEETCKSWIPPSAIGEGAVINCATCRTYICRTRQGKAHPPHKPCPQQQVPNQKNTGTQAINGWRECFKCRSMVEAVEGYNIMICGCGAEFCYSCGNVWKTCNCQDHNHRLSPHLSIFDPQSILMPRIAEQRQQQTRQSQEEDKRTAQRQAQGENQRQAEAAAAAEEKSRQLSAKYTALEQKLETLHSRQRSLVHSRHERETQALQRTLSAGKTSHLLSLQEEKTNLLTRQASEKATLEATFQKERTELSEKHAADEDDYWFSLQTYLRDRPNKEARQKALMDKLTVAQKEEMTGLAMQQEERLAASLADIDRRLHEVEDEIRRGAQDNGERRKDLARRQWAEWKWFKVILERRVAVLVEEREVEEKRERERGYSVHMLGGYLQAKEVEG